LLAVGQFAGQFRPECCDQEAEHNYGETDLKDGGRIHIKFVGVDSCEIYPESS